MSEKHLSAIASAAFDLMHEIDTLECSGQVKHWETAQMLRQALGMPTPWERRK
jgi:hypothetical protein